MVFGGVIFAGVKINNPRGMDFPRISLIIIIAGISESITVASYSFID